MICTGQLEQTAYRSPARRSFRVDYNDLIIIGIPTSHTDPINLSAVNYYSQKIY